MTLNVPPDRPIRTLPERRRAALLLVMNASGLEDDAAALAHVVQSTWIPRPVRLDAAIALSGLSRSEILLSSKRRRK